ncbi:MAG: Imm5 family immunity protein [Acidimicrobiales bacterium]
MREELPAELREALAVARRVLAESPTGELPLSVRRAIWDALGEAPMPGSAGHRRRAALDLLAAERVKPVWESAYPTDPTVDEVLDASRQVAQGERPAPWADDIANRAEVHVLDLTSADRQFNAGSAGDAAVAALYAAAHDRDHDDLPADADDYDLDSEDWDAGFLAALALAGGEVGDPAASDVRRREFWEWYLREAVPAAWRSAT